MYIKREIEFWLGSGFGFKQRRGLGRAREDTQIGVYPVVCSLVVLLFLI